MRDVSSPRTAPSPRGPRRAGARRSLAATLALLAGGLVVAQTPTASATQAPGDDVVAWSNGWSWTYATSFHYVGDAANVTLNENVTYTVAGSTTFNGQDAYQLNITGNITGGGGNADAGSAGNVSLDSFSGSVSGTRIVRKSDLALLQENQHQHLDAKAHKIIAIDVTADIDLQLTPSPGWRTRDFPLNAGDSWQNDESIAYHGGFSYDSSLASGSSPFDGSFDFDGASTVSNDTVNGLSTKKISAQANTSDGTAVDDIWWSPAKKNDAKEHMVLPLDGATLTIDRNLTSSSTPTPGSTMTLDVTPSLTCAGGDVTVSGKLGNSAGVPVSIYLDKSPVSAGSKIILDTTTGANGSFSKTFASPSQSDGLSKNGSRANWGIYASGGGANAATTLVVTPKDCTTLAYTGMTTAPRGTDATVSAKLTNLGSGSASGRTITFTIDGETANATTNGSGVATTTIPVGDTARTTSVSAHYAGTSTTEPASISAPFTVGKVGTVVSVSPSLPSVELGEPVTFTADVTSAQTGVGTPDGTVQFIVDGSSFGGAVPLTSGSATSASISTLTVGSHTVQATYGGSAGFDGSQSSEVTFEVTPPRAPTSTSLSATPSTAVYGQTVGLGASVTASGGGATPTGSVTFTRGATVIDTVPLDASGHATLDTDALPVGSNAVVATYTGDGDYKSSASAPTSVVVNKASVSVDLQSSASPTVTGEAVGFTASVGAVAPGAGTPDGTVQLQVDGNDVGPAVPLTGGVATFDSVTSLAAGSHAVKAVYSGSASFEAGSDSITQDVNQADTTTTVMTSPAITNEGEEFTVTASVVAVAPGSGTPSGSVAFTADGASIGAGTVDSSGQASITVNTLAPGDHVIVASYAGSADYNGSTSQSVNHTVVEGAAVVATTTALSSSQNPAIYGQLISFTADVDAADGSAPAGAVQFSVDGTNIGGPVTVDGDGVAVSLMLAAPGPGDHSVIAAFQADAGFADSGDLLTQTVTNAIVDIALTSSDSSSDYGQAVHFTADVTSAQAGTLPPTGTVQFGVDGTPLGDAVQIQNGTAVSPDVSALAPGDHAVTALYSGDINFASVTTGLTQQVAKITTTTTLDVSPTSSTYGDPIDLTATVAPAQSALGTPTGSVDFMDGSATLATVPLDDDGTAHATFSDLGAGSHSITAVYSGAASFAGSTSAATTIDIARRQTSVHAEPAVVKLFPLGLPLGRLKATVSSSLGPVAGVPVVFTIGGTTVGTATTDVNGVASLNASSQLLALILHAGYTATFGGNADFEDSSDRGGIL